MAAAHGWARRLTAAGTRPWLLVALVALAALGLGAPRALAANWTWSGTGAESSPNWSNATNWGDDSTPSGNQGAFTFPALGSCPSDAACYDSDDDIGGLTAGSISIDGGSSYIIYGDSSACSGGCSLNLSGGLSTTTSSTEGLDLLELPLVLTGSQTWTLRGDGTMFDNVVTVYSVTVPVGSANSLTLDLSGNAGLELAGDVEVGPINVSGEGSVDQLDGDLNGTDGKSVTIGPGATLWTPFDEGFQTGPLTTNGGVLEIGDGISPDDGVLAVTGAVTLNSSSTVQLWIDAPGSSGSQPTPGADFSQLSASGAINLAGAELDLQGVLDNDCNQLNAGDVYKIVSGSSVTGTFSNAPQGSDVLLDECSQDPTTVQIGYTSNAVTATVVATPSSSTSLTSSPARPLTNQPVTLTATVSASSGSPSGGTVEFDNGGSPISGCVAQPVTPAGSAYAATCATMFSATTSPESLTATFTPGSGSPVTGSTSSTDNVPVGLDGTATTLVASNPLPAAGGSVTYAAVVTPNDAGPTLPSGSVLFLDGGSPISACTGQPLSNLTASCAVSYAAAGSHTITAVYSGDGNFTRSTSAGVAVTVGSGQSSTAPSAPMAVTLAASVTSTTSATLMATVDPEGAATSASFQYGLDTTYGATTPAQTVGSDSTSHQVTVAVTGLLPNVTYHVRVVAMSAGGTTDGNDVTFRTPADPPPPPPTFAKDVNVMPVAGTIYIKLPGGATLEGARLSSSWFGRFAGPLSKGQGFMPLTEARQIPVGSQVDARQGTLQLVTASTARHKTFNGDFGGGLFSIAQERKQQGLTTLKLMEGSFTGAPSFKVCASTGKASARAAHAAAKPKKLSSTVVDLLKASSTGRFATAGRYSSSTVEGTQWQVADQCNGTLTKVIRGVVSVRDLVRRKTIRLHTGQSYLARPR